MSTFSGAPFIFFVHHFQNNLPTPLADSDEKLIYKILIVELMLNTNNVIIHVT